MDYGEKNMMRDLITMGGARLADPAARIRYIGHQLGDVIDDVSASEFLNELYFGADNEHVGDQRDAYVRGVLECLRVCGCPAEALAACRAEFERRYLPDGDLYYLIADEDAEEGGE